MDLTDTFRDIISSHIRSNGGGITTNTHRHATTPFMQHAIQLRNRLSSIEAFIKRTSQSYLLVKPLLWSEIPYISDSERSVIDDNLERQLHESSRWLEQLKEEVKKSYRQTTGNQITIGIREHNQHIVVALLTRLSEISKKVGRLQTAHYEAVLTSQSPFASWMALKSDKLDIGSVYPSMVPEAPISPLLSSDDLNEESVIPTLLHALCSTLSESEALALSGKVHSKGAKTIEERAYAVLLATAHKQLQCLENDKSTRTHLPLSLFGSKVEMVLLRGGDSWKGEWDQVVRAACHCWHWKELRSYLHDQHHVREKEREGGRYSTICLGSHSFSRVLIMCVYPFITCSRWTGKMVVCSVLYVVPTTVAKLSISKLLQMSFKFI